MDGIVPPDVPEIEGTNVSRIRFNCRGTRGWKYFYSRWWPTSCLDKFNDMFNDGWNDAQKEDDDGKYDALRLIV